MTTAAVDDIERPVILCVDDEAQALFIRKCILEQHGYEVLTALDANAALLESHIRMWSPRVGSYLIWLVSANSLYSPPLRS